MSKFVDGRLDTDTKEQVLDAMMADAKAYFGDDLNPAQEAIIRSFYSPVAEKFVELQNTASGILDSAQIDHAAGAALDLLVALIGVTRFPPIQAEGVVTFSRDTAASQDYVIPEGTEVQTNSPVPVKFVTSEVATLASGTTSVDAPVIAVEGGVDGNVGPNSLTVMPNPPSGVEDVTNANATTGGSDEEDDTELRKRAKDELGSGSRASADSLIRAARGVQDVTSVTIFLNNGNVTQIANGGEDGFELVVSGGVVDDLAQAIRDAMAAGDTSWGGYNGTKVTGTATLDSGQTVSVDFSRPVEVQIYVDMTLTTTAEWEGGDAVRDRIIEYLGGTRTSGNEVSGLQTGDDVIYGEIEYAIRDIPGVYDVDSLTIGTAANPTGTSNIAIADNEVALGDGTDGSITIS